MFTRLAVATMMLSGVVLSGAESSQAQKPAVKNVVLVHGAWADGSGWKGVYDILARDGFKVSIVQS